MGVKVAGKTPSLKGEFAGETHRALEHTETYQTGKSAPEGPNLIVGSRGND